MKRKDYISWDEYFMGLALLSAMRSKDPNTKVGACIVDDDNKVKAITKVLTRLNYENFDVGQLPIQDVLFILYKLHGAFISKKITRKVYIDDSIEDEKLLNADENLEEVDIPITSIIYAYLGKDYDDNDLEGKVKVPFTIRDTTSNDTIKFKFTFCLFIFL